MRVQVIDELSQLEPLAGDWDELAVAGELPLMSPACVTAWWRQLAPATAEPRVVTVEDAGKVVGIAPFYLDPAGRRARLGLRLPGIELGGRLAPLAAPGREAEVGLALADALAESGLCRDLLALEGTPVAADWITRLRESWPGMRPTTRRYRTSGCPTISLRAETFEEWLNGKSSNFRSEMRRLRRKLEATGGRIRSTTHDSLAADVEIFRRLHELRWTGRGSSGLLALGPRLPRLLHDIGRTLLDHDGRFRLIVCEVEGEPISAQLFLAAGGRVLYINGGWDERFARLKPSMLGLLAVTEEAFVRSEDCVDLGLGEQHYKLRFADRNEPVSWNLLIPAGARLPLSFLRTAPLRCRAAVADTLRHHLTERQYSQLRQRLLRVKI